MPLLSRRLWSTCAVAVATFAAGLIVGSVRRAEADAPAMTPMIIHVPGPHVRRAPAAAKGMNMQNKVVVTAEGATVQVQLGMIGKHYHANSNEVQYIIEGQGKFWLGDSYKDVGPGDLIIIPKGTQHVGATTAMKAIAIKTPPQAKDDLHLATP